MEEDSRSQMRSSASIKDVAALAGVSISTVSNVLNDTKAVSPALRQKVFDAARDLQYQANAIARGLKSGKTNALCVIVPSIVSVFFPRVLHGMQTAAAQKGYSLSIYETGEDILREQAYIHMLRRQWADGILISTCANKETDAEYINELRQLRIGGKRIPVVFFEAAPDEGLDTVMVDNQEASRAAALYLIGIGRRKIAYIAAPRRFAMGRERFNGYASALEDAGLKYNPGLVRDGDYTPVSGYALMRSLLQEGPKPDAVLCGNDQMAVGAIRAILEAGVTIPDEIAVMGFDNNFPGTLVYPSLSTVSVPKQRMGSEAVELLLWRMQQGEDAPSRIVTLETNLIIRESTDKNAISTWDLFGW